MQKRVGFFIIVLCLAVCSFFSGCASGTLLLDWKCPKAGMTPDSFAASFPPSIECGGKESSVSKMSWMDVTGDSYELMDPSNDTFVSEHTYQVVMEIEIGKGISIGTNDVVSTTKGFMPGMTVKKDDQHFDVYFRFVIDPEETTQDDILSIACSVPQIGLTAEQIEMKEATVLFNGKKLDASFSDWRVYDLKRSNEGDSWNKETPFELGHYYSVLLSMNAPSTYSKEYTVLRSNMEILHEDSMDGQIALRLFFDQLAYRIDSPEIMIDAVDLRDGISVKDVNKQLKVTIGENIEDETMFYWYKRVDGVESVLSDKELFSAQDNGIYYVDIQFPIGNEINEEEFSLQINGGDYSFHSGLMSHIEDGQKYGTVRFVYDGGSILPSEETFANANVEIYVPSLIHEKNLDTINEEIKVLALKRSVDTISIQWEAYVENNRHVLNSKADLLDGYCTTEAGDQKVDYYLLTLDFPMVRINDENIQLAIECEGKKTSWISFWEDEENDVEMAKVMILIDATKISHHTEPTMGTQNAFLYIPQILAGNTPEYTNSHFMFMVNGSEIKDYEIQWVQGTDENDESIALEDSDPFKFGEEEPGLDLYIRFNDETMLMDSTDQFVLGSFGYGQKNNKVDVSLDKETKEITLKVPDVEAGKAFVKISAPTAYIGSELSFDPSDYKAVWTDEYQTVEMDVWKVEWRASEYEFSSGNAGAETEESLWEGTTFGSSMHYVTDVFAATPENRLGTETVCVYSGPSTSLMSASTLVSWMIMWEEEVNLVRAHLDVVPVSSGKCIQHSFILNEQESVAPTCSSEGLNVYYCENCDTKMEETLSTISHDRVYNSSASRAADCTSEGVDVYTCANCGAEWEETTERLNHVMRISTSQSTEATCQHAGSEVSICDNCGYRSTRILPKVEHDYRRTGEGTPATCENMGTVIYSCRRCGDSYTEYVRALGHTYVFDSEKSKDATCTRDGLEVRSCSVCGKVGTERTISALGHDYHRDDAASRPATVEQEGEEVSVCSRCGDVFRVTLPKLQEEHVHDFEEIRIESTCTTQGSVTRRCKTCGHEDDNVTILPLAAHNFDFIGVGLVPSSFEDGYNLVKCSVCGKEEQEIVPAYGTHAMKLISDESISASCDHEGLEVWRCTHARCDYEERMVLTRLPHNYAAGGNANGTHTLTCTVCGDSYTESCQYADGRCSVCGDTEASMDDSENVMG